MKIDVPDVYLRLVITALDHYFAYTVALKREDGRYRRAADFFRQVEEERAGETA